MQRSDEVPKRHHSDGLSQSSATSNGGPTCRERSHTAIHSGPLFSTPTSICSLLKMLGMSFGSYGFVCEISSTLVPASILDAHVGHNHHKRRLSNRTKAYRKGLVKHLLDSHGLVATTPCPNPTGDLSGPIPGLQPLWAAICPHPGCASWSLMQISRGSLKSQQANARRHVSSVHPEHAATYLADVFETRWIYRPFQTSLDARDPLVLTVWPFAEGYTPPLAVEGIQKFSLLQPSSHFAPTTHLSTQYLIGLRWPAFIASLGAQADSLRELMRLRSKKEARSLTGVERQLELGLITVRKLYRSYLVDIQVYLSSKGDVQFRQAVTMNTKAHFRSLRRASYYTYSRPLSRCVCMLMRWIHAEYTGNLASFGTLHIRRSLAQEYAANMLYHYLIQTKIPRPAALLQLLHQLLVTLVKQKFTNLQTMACPTDYALCMGSLADNGGFLLAAATTKTCAVLQHNFYTIIIHSARLEDNAHQRFVPFNLDNFTSDPVPDTGEPSQPVEEPAPALYEEEGADDSLVVQLQEVEEDFVDGHDDDIDPEEGDPMLSYEAKGEWDFEEEETFHSYYLNGDTAENLDTYYDPQSSLPAQRCPARIISGNDRGLGSSSVLNILAENLTYLQPLLASHPSFATPYNQIKTVWFAARPTAFKEQRNYGFIFAEDGTAITMRDGDDISQSILFSDLGRLAKAAISDVSEQIMKCLPDGCQSLLQQFYGIFSQLVDDLSSPDAIFLQPSNRILLQPLLDVMLQRLVDPEEPKHHITGSSSSINEECARQWLDFNERILGQIIVAFLLTCGIPPRHWQFRSLLFQSDSSTGGVRNLYLLGSELVIGNPEAKQINQVTRECMWAFPPSLAPLISFYLAIVRPSVIRISGLIHHVNQAHRTHIFSHTFTATRLEYPHVWNGSDVNAALWAHTSSLNVRLTCSLLRNAVTAMYHQFFPALSQSESVGVQPVQKAGSNRRPPSDHVPPALGMSFEQARKYISSSHALQALYGLRCPDNNLADRNSAILGNLKHASLALKEARLCVREEYDLYNAHLPAMSGKAASILDAAPYICLKEDMIGDEVLRRILHVVLFGDSKPSVFDRPPPGGYLITDVSRAVVQIIQAIEEQEHGFEYDLTRQTDVDAIIHFDEVEKKAQLFLATLKDENPKSWTQLCSEVHQLYQKAPGADGERSWVVRGIPG
ncbi:uncharacterized protein F5891DRAFT_1256536 [Suillus fuscotomentosus]|uniref:Uncharacterized protein n=1 Tax=Suillus fuscotomentosus TaxID=1912939 RepID=A0AAD4DUC7_9AGAM|nr:uncharacterized protein F5891DRAFT_1256536 [Suillus fuscotomentosus]KAG1894096.1 hypothetical protein F5891DRAFT_1256536 [Suillus fuscotomentosus]